eukprot:m.181856 g.181856  ORF g.181856 m.181856 type:complete len:522 (+) comp24609_c0_seq1:47-1612(+)
MSAAAWPSCRVACSSRPRRGTSSRTSIAVLFAAVGVCLQFGHMCEGTEGVDSVTQVRSAAPRHSSTEATAATSSTPVVSFGIVTDVHYADAAPSGTRIYRDSVDKVKAAVDTFNAAGSTDFIISLGDLKDTDASRGCDTPNVPASPACVNLTIGFLKTIEGVLAGFNGPRHHLLGNHDVDILTQLEVLNSTTDTPLSPGSPGSAGGPGYSSWSLPDSSAPPTNTSLDTTGCLVRSPSGGNIWVVHSDGSRNWLSTSASHTEWQASALVVANIDVYPKRHGGSGAYSLDSDDSSAAFAQRCTVGHCLCDPATGTANGSTLPHGQSPAPALRFVRLNADYTDQDIAWADLDNLNGPGAVPGMSWEHANVPSFQLTWLAAELEAAKSMGQHVVVFVHYRVDGGPGGPVGTGLGPSTVKSRSWVDDCSLQNAAVLRDVLEHHSGLVLAVFSGHDHVPQPPYTKETASSPLYYTHHALVEGALPHNAYSIVDVLPNCTIVIHGYVDAGNVTIAGPPGHNCSSASTP